MSAFGEIITFIVDEIPDVGNEFTKYQLRSTGELYKWNGTAYIVESTGAPVVTSGFLQASNNLSDVTSTGTARSNLGLGTLATQNGTFSGSSSGTNTGDETLASLQAIINANARPRILIYMASVIGDQPSSGSWSLPQVNGFTIYRWTTGSGGSSKTATARWNSTLGSDFGSWPTGAVSIETRRSATATTFVLQFLDNTGAQIGSNISVNPTALNTFETFVVDVPANAYWGVNKKFTMRLSITTTAASATFDVYLNNVEYKPNVI